MVGASSDLNGDGVSDLLFDIDVGLVTFFGRTDFGGKQANFDVVLDYRTTFAKGVLGDFNGDGFIDSFFRGYATTFSDRSSVLFSKAGGGFTPSEQFIIPGVQQDWSVQLTGDFNGDGRDDIIWRHTTGELAEWLGQSNNRFLNNSLVAGTKVGNDWKILAAGDFNGDGRDDLIWRHTSGVMTEWLGQSDGTFVDNFTTLKQTVGLDWRIVAAGDFNGDGREDLIWRHSSGEYTQWLGQADGSFFNNSKLASAKIDNGWSVIGVGDYNGDGHSDLVWRYDPTGQLTEYLGKSDGSFSQIQLSGVVPATWHSNSPDLFFA